MEKLSVENLQGIFFLLDQQQKIQCMLTCRRWEKIITNSCLFDTVHVSTVGGLFKLKEKLIREPTRRAQVRRLIFAMEDVAFSDFNDITSILPGLRSLYINPSLCPNSGTHQLYASSIEHLVEANSMEFGCTFLQNNICLNLTTLSLMTSSTQLFIIVQLLRKAAPNLVKLSLHNFHFNIDDIELLHEGLVKLKTIEFTDTLLIELFDDEPLPKKIKPAPSVESFTFHFLELMPVEVQMKWFKYMTKKYPNLKTCHFGYLGNSRLLPMAESKLNLKKHQNAGLVPFFKKFGSKLESFSFRSKMIFLDIFDIMEKHNSKIQNVRFSVSMGSVIADFFSKRSHVVHVETLVLDESTIGNFDFLKRLTSLKNLTVYSNCYATKVPAIKLNQLLDAATSLQSLTLYSAILECDDSVPAKLYPLKRLFITKSKLPDSLDHFLNNSTNQLNSLKFDLCHNFRNNLINLPQLNLSYFEYRVYWSSNNDILIHTLKNNEKRYWRTTHSYNLDDKFEETFTINDATLYPHMKSIPYDSAASNQEPPLTLICNSLYTVALLTPMYF